jgi:hypothetical protein
MLVSVFGRTSMSLARPNTMRDWFPDNSDAPFESTDIKTAREKIGPFPWSRLSLC